MNQSVGLHEIEVETVRPDRLTAESMKIITVHKPGTAPMRECDANTFVIYAENGKEYPFDFVETEYSARV